MNKVIKAIRKLMCRIGWHSPIDYRNDPKDPRHFLVFARCKYCGYEGQIDSQGNLY